jgi:ABC-type Fe3+ transport system permease subunit
MPRWAEEPGTADGVQVPGEGHMDLWGALGISRETGLLAAAVGIAVAVVMALVLSRRNARDEAPGVRLNDRD